MEFFRKIFRSEHSEQASSRKQVASHTRDAAAPIDMKPAAANSGEHPPEDTANETPRDTADSHTQMSDDRIQDAQHAAPATGETARHSESSGAGADNTVAASEAFVADPLSSDNEPVAASPDQVELVPADPTERGAPEAIRPKGPAATEPLSVISPPDQGTNKLDPQRAPSLAQQRSAQGLAIAALRDIGRVRESNQDSVLALLTTLPRENRDLPMGLFIVADGMGGHAGGEVASRLAIRTVAHEVLAHLVLPALDDEIIEALQPLMIRALEEANRAIWEHAQTINSDMGTTCTAVLMLGQALYIAHVGDTRAYVLGSKGLQVLTDDHSAVGRLIQLGQLDPAEAHEHPLRSQLYRTVGQQPTVQVDFVYHPISDDTHLLLCSDGLWSMVSDPEIAQTLGHWHWPQDICQELIALANLAGGEDNISSVVVTFPVAERSS